MRRFHVQQFRVRFRRGQPEGREFASWISVDAPELYFWALSSRSLPRPAATNSEPLPSAQESHTRLKVARPHKRTLYIHIHTHTQTQTQTQTHTHTHIQTYLLIYLHTYILTYLHTYVVQDMRPHCGIFHTDVNGTGRQNLIWHRCPRGSKASHGASQ